MKERKLTVADIINIYGKTVKGVKVFNKKQQVKANIFMQDEPKAFSLSDEEEVLRIYIDAESSEASFDGMLSEDEPAEIAQDITKKEGEVVAAGLAEYAKLVEQLAAELTDEQLEDSGHIKNLYQNILPRWDWEEWYDLLKAVRQKKRQAEHEEKTAEVIFNEMPYFAQAAGQQAVKYLVECARKNRLFKIDDAADWQADILWQMFYCMGIDVKTAAETLSKKSISLNGLDLQDNKYLLAFIEELRAEQWKQGEVTKLRTKELR